MSVAPPVQRPASRQLAVLALVGLGCWATLTALSGAFGALSAVRSMSAAPVLVTGTEPSTTLDVTPGLVVGGGLFLLWVLSLNLVVIAAVLGMVDLATVRRSWRRSVAFGLVAIGGPILVLVMTQIDTDDVEPSGGSYLAAVAPGFAMVAAALVVMLLAWRLLDVRGRA